MAQTFSSEDEIAYPEDRNDGAVFTDAVDVHLFGTEHEILVLQRIVGTMSEKFFLGHLFAALDVFRVWPAQSQVAGSIFII